MRKVIAFSGLFALALAITATENFAAGQLPAQKGGAKKGDAKDARPTALPPGKTDTGEPDKVTAGKVTRTVVEKVNGKEVRKKVQQDYADIPNPQYRIGATGFPSDEGFMVWSSVRVLDRTAGRRRAPIDEVEVDFTGGGTFLTVRLERGDVILSIDGIDTKSVGDVVVAVNVASVDRLPIEFVDFRSGNILSGFITRAKIRN